MMSNLENVLVECLCDTLAVSLYSESSELIGTINSIIGRYPLFNFTKVRSTETLKSTVSQKARWLCAIIDARCSFLKDVFESVREIKAWQPVILMTDSVSDDFQLINGLTRYSEDSYIFTNKGSEDKKNGHEESKIIHVCPLRGYKKMFDVLLVESIKKKLFSRKIPTCIAHKALSVLLDQSPVTVEGWSEQLALTPRKLQRILKVYSDYSPKKIISLYHAYHIAFSTIDETKNTSRGIIPAYMLDDQSKRRVMEYVLSRRSQLLS